MFYETLSFPSWDQFSCLRCYQWYILNELFLDLMSVFSAGCEISETDLLKEPLQLNCCSYNYYNHCLITDMFIITDRRPIIRTDWCWNVGVSVTVPRDICCSKTRPVSFPPPEILFYYTKELYSQVCHFFFSVPDPQTLLFSQLSLLDRPILLNVCW